MTIFAQRNKSVAAINQMAMDTNHSDKNGAFKIGNNWAMQSKELKSQFSQLTDADLKFETGKENELLDRVESRLNKNRDEVINIINKSQHTKE